MTHIVHGNLRIDLVDSHGGSVSRTTIGLRSPAVRVEPAEEPRTRPVRLLGRDAQTVAAQTVAPGSPVEFHAPCGYGKSALLQHLAEQQGTGAVYLRAGDGRLGDLRQRLFAAFYQVSTPFKPTREQYAELLAEVRGLVVLDDVSFSPATARALVRSLPNCAVVLGSTRPLLGSQAGSSVLLAGLSTADALQLLARDLGRHLTATETAEAERLLAAIDHQPLHVRQAAALLTQGPHTFADLAGEVEADPLALDRLSVGALSRDERRVLALLAVTAGVLLPSELVEAATGLSEAWGALTALRRRGLVEERNDRFGLPVCHVDEYRKLLTRHLDVGSALRGMADFIQDLDPSGKDALSGADAAVTAIGYAAEHGEWAAIARLAVAIDKILALAGHWDAWRDVLERGIEAARRIGDTGIEAYLVHQLGALEYAEDNLGAAGEHWRRAEELRTELGDTAGTRRTRENLALLAPLLVEPPPPEPDPGRGLPAKRVRAAAAIGVVVVVMVPLLVRAVWGGEHDGAPTTPRSTGAMTGPPAPSTSAGSPGTIPGGPVPGVPVPSATGSVPTTPRGAFRPVVADVTSTPAAYSGTCPTAVAFAGVVSTATGTGEVTYRWVHDDGTASQAERISLGGVFPARRTVRATRSVPAEGERRVHSGSAALELLSPARATSEPATYEVTCVPANPRATVDTPVRTSSDAPCPAIVPFTGVIEVDAGPAVVTYRWVLREDEGPDVRGPVETVTFDGTGRQKKVISHDFAVPDPYSRRVFVEFLTPVESSSEQVTFRGACTPAEPSTTPTTRPPAR